MPAPANAQAKPNPLVISVKTLIDTPAPKHFIAKTVKVKHLATSKGKQPASQDELNKFIRISISNPSSNNKSSNDLDYNLEVFSIKQVTSSSLDARLYRTPCKAVYFNYIIKLCTYLQPSIYYNSINTRIKRCTRYRCRRKYKPIPK